MPQYLSEEVPEPVRTASEWVKIQAGRAAVASERCFSSEKIMSERQLQANEPTISAP